MFRRALSTALLVIYAIVGFVVANSHNYFGNLDAVMPILSAILAVLLWPLVLLGVDLHI